MRFTGTLIEDLMAAVERAEQRAQADEPLFAEGLAAEALAVESLAVESWFASTQENKEYDSKFIGVA
jgi:hypothetical protein